MKTEKMIVILAIAAFLTACANTTPVPIPVSQPGDKDMSCESIAEEMSAMAQKVQTSNSELNNQIAKNSVLGVTGFFLLVPLFFMDASDAHTVEAKAARDRYYKLNSLYRDRKCHVPVDPLPEEKAGNQSESDTNSQVR